MAVHRPAVSVLLPAVVLLASLLLASGSAEDDPRVAELLELQRRSPDRVVQLNGAIFERVGKGSAPRPYALVIFFDAREMQAEDPELRLKEFGREFALVARAYAKTHAKTPEATKVFFCTIDFSDSEDVFRAFRVQSLPHIRVLPEGKAKSSPLEQGNHPLTAEGVAAFVLAKTGIAVGTIERPPPITTAQMAIIGALVLATLPFAVRHVLTRRTVIGDPRLWCFLALAVYFFSVSGGMFNIIRKMPMSIPSRRDSGKRVYWYDSGDAQFGVEGFAIGGLYTVVGLLLAVVTRGAPRVASRILQRLLVLVCLAAGFLAVRQVGLLDNWKTGYSIYPFFPSSWS